MRPRLRYDRGSVLSGACSLQAAASGELALFAFDAAAAAPRDSLVAALGMMAQAATASIATVTPIVHGSDTPYASPYVRRVLSRADSPREYHTHRQHGRA